MKIEGQQKTVTEKRIYIAVKPRNGDWFRHDTERTSPFRTVKQAKDVIRKVRLGDEAGGMQYDKVYPQLRRYIDEGCKVGVEIETETKVVSSVFAESKR